MNLHENDYINISDIQDPKTESILTYGWYRYLFKRGIKQQKKMQKQIAHTNCPIDVGKILCFIPSILNDINKENTEVFQCTIESDFAIKNHIDIYNKFTYPRIITNDTDLLVLLCDVDCEIEISVKLQYGNNTTFERYVLNPIKFWFEVFKCHLKPEIIKILCVLVGTDFNLYNKLSPIHLYSFNSILKPLKCNSFSDINVDSLKLYIYKIALQNSDDIHVKETMVALNMYLNNIEGSLQPIDNIDLRFEG
jgi:hypothetical protein